MEDPNYLIINPLQIEIFMQQNNQENITEIDKKFNEKIKWLKNINDNLKRIKIRKLLMDI